MNPDQNSDRNGRVHEAQPIEPPVSRLIIEFESPGSAQFRVAQENVSPAQMLGLAAWLDWQARQSFDHLAAMQQARES